MCSAPHGIPCSIGVCPHGCVTLGFGPTSVHLRSQEFCRLFAALEHVVREIETSHRILPQEI